MNRTRAFEQRDANPRQPARHRRAVNHARRRHGTAIDGEARLIEGDEVRRAKKLVRRATWFTQGVLVPVSHKLVRYRTMYYRLTPAPGPTDAA